MCHSPSVSCVDCLKNFTIQDFVLHSSCISERAKYDKSNLYESDCRGAQKQTDWTTSVHSRLVNYQAPPGVPTLMKKMILTSANVPRKKAKFEFARPTDIDALWQQMTAQGDKADSAGSIEKVNHNGTDQATLGEHLVQNSEENHSKLQLSSHVVEMSGDGETNDKGKNSLLFSLFRLQTFESFKQSKHFVKEMHSDGFLECEFQRALKKRRHFVISEDQKKVSISDTKT
ncbi:unnamed protein product [Hydatigera taeniaeformis]|uniref:Zf-LYAR domain-containing protein n=1 Tax=Hydatigena taeniaeformis TaxID=6205 RepID=A0A0R3WVL5_HYDTA|nr:unnamed protein product [Hydatigera taeniaeformis]